MQSVSARRIFGAETRDRPVAGADDNYDDQDDATFDLKQTSSPVAATCQRARSFTRTSTR